MLSRSSQAVPLTTDHKPDLEAELARIEGAGGAVVHINGTHRLMGVLAMTRAIGDHFLKPYITCEPEVVVTERSAADDLLVIGSDGLWDVLGNQEVVNIATRCLRRTAERGLSRRAGCRIAANVLARVALERGSRDNITAVVVDVRLPGSDAAAAEAAPEASVGVALHRLLQGGGSSDASAASAAGAPPQAPAVQQQQQQPSASCGTQHEAAVGEDVSPPPVSDCHACADTDDHRRRSLAVASQEPSKVPRRDSAATPGGTVRAALATAATTAAACVAMPPGSPMHRSMAPAQHTWVSPAASASLKAWSPCLVVSRRPSGSLPASLLPPPASPAGDVAAVAAEPVFS